LTFQATIDGIASNIGKDDGEKDKHEKELERYKLTPLSDGILHDSLRSRYDSFMEQDALREEVIIVCFVYTLTYWP
jgi:hypothetical protein